ncbi:DUF6777 domain-containing protein [Streptomyces sp. NPDC015171]|uniref:DUF6777 domain-containing protein n=1 Tax=Streptomyces sp. NPDC015171 TaxID=3364945 RepID=UPI0036FB6FD0
MRIPTGTIVVAYTLLAAFLATGCAGTGVKQARTGEMVYLQPATERGPEPFTDSTVNAAAARSSRPTTSASPGEPEAPLRAARTLSGATPGLYRGTPRVAGCDVERHVGYLTADEARADAFARVAGVSRAELPGYLRGLTPVVLGADTRVSNHTYRDRRASRYQAVLQAGTAVLVDDRGVPRVRCACGNPLTPPAPTRGGAAARGTPWSGYRANGVVVVTPAPRAVTSITIVDEETRTWTRRRVGPDVRRDQVVPAPPGATAVPSPPGPSSSSSASSPSASSPGQSAPVPPETAPPGAGPQEAGGEGAGLQEAGGEGAGLPDADSSDAGPSSTSPSSTGLSGAGLSGAGRLSAGLSGIGASVVGRPLAELSGAALPDAGASDTGRAGEGRSELSESGPRESGPARTGPPAAGRPVADPSDRDLSVMGSPGADPSDTGLSVMGSPGTGSPVTDPSDTGLPGTGPSVVSRSGADRPGVGQMDARQPGTGPPEDVPPVGAGPDPRPPRTDESDPAAADRTGTPHPDGRTPPDRRTGTPDDAASRADRHTATPAAPPRSTAPPAAPSEAVPGQEGRVPGAAGGPVS